MFDISATQPCATFCGDHCGDCPQLFIDESAPPTQRIVLTDDFGSQIRMSTDQFRDLLAQAKTGTLDTII
jgi:hypothetical protein